MNANPAAGFARTIILTLTVFLGVSMWIGLGSMAARAADQSPEDLFAKAGSFYQKGEYGNAISAYESILKNGFASASLYYNLGNAYFKAGIMPAAILNYERALRLSPGDEDMRFNLEMANHRIVDKIEVLPEFFVSAWIRSLQQSFSADAWAYGAILCLLIFLLSLSLFLFSRSVVLKKMAFPVVAVSLLIAVGSLWLGARQQRAVENRQEAIIFNPTVTVKGSPDAASTDLFLLHEGTKVFLIDSINSWREIRIADGNKGWIEVSNLRVI